MIGNTVSHRRTLPCRDTESPGCTRYPVSPVRKPTPARERQYGTRVFENSTRVFAYQYTGSLRTVHGFLEFAICRMAGLEGLEPPTVNLEGCCSIHLSYSPRMPYVACPGRTACPLVACFAACPHLTGVSGTGSGICRGPVPALCRCHFLVYWKLFASQLHVAPLYHLRQRRYSSIMAFSPGRVSGLGVDR